MHPYGLTRTEEQHADDLAGCRKTGAKTHHYSSGRYGGPARALHSLREGGKADARRHLKRRARAEGKSLIQAGLGEATVERFVAELHANTDGLYAGELSYDAFAERNRRIWERITAAGEEVRSAVLEQLLERLRVAR